MISCYFRPGIGLAILACAAVSCTPLRPLVRVHHGPKPAAEAEPLAEFVVLADTHEHNLYARPGVLNKGIADLVCDAAVRPPQLAAWDSDLLAWVRALDAVDSLTIHLGDATDVACTGEWDAFLKAMRADGREPRTQWFMAPGNHDMSYMGNRDTADVAKSWKKACFMAGGPMDKAALVARYVSRLQEDNLVALPADLRRAAAQVVSGAGVSARALWQIAPADLNGPLERLAVAFHPDKVSRSFVLQQVRVADSVSVILVDTTQYGSGPWAAGLRGQVRKNQREIVRRWVEENAAAGRQTLLAGHHPMAELPDRVKQFLVDLASRHPVVGFVSAHVHGASRILSYRDWLELNVASTLLWPMEYGRLRLERLPAAQPAGTGATALRMTWKRVKLSGLLDAGEAGCAAREAAWRPEDKNDVEYYTSYRTTDTDRSDARFLDAQIKSWLRVLNGVGDEQLGGREELELLHAALTDKRHKAKRSAIMATEEARRQRWASTEVSRVIQAYALCQVRWASETEAVSDPESAELAASLSVSASGAD